MPTDYDNHVIWYKKLWKWFQTACVLAEGLTIPPSAAYIRKKLQYMKQLQWNLSQNTKLFIHENAFETIVCEKVATGQIS